MFSSHSDHQAPLPKLRRQRTQERDGAAAKRVTFIESTAADGRVRAPECTTVNVQKKVCLQRRPYDEPWRAQRADQCLSPPRLLKTTLCAHVSWYQTYIFDLLWTENVIIFVFLLVWGPEFGSESCCVCREESNTPSCCQVTFILLLDQFYWWTNLISGHFKDIAQFKSNYSPILCNRYMSRSRPDTSFLVAHETKLHNP